MAVASGPGNHGVRTCKAEVPSSFSHATVVFRGKGSYLKVHLNSLTGKKPLSLRNDESRERVIANGAQIIHLASSSYFSLAPSAYRSRQVGPTSPF